jgi:hypothetical protein
MRDAGQMQDRCRRGTSTFLYVLRVESRLTRPHPGPVLVATARRRPVMYMMYVVMMLPVGW